MDRDLSTTSFKPGADLKWARSLPTDGYVLHKIETEILRASGLPMFDAIGEFNFWISEHASRSLPGHKRLSEGQKRCYAAASVAEAEGATLSTIREAVAKAIK